MPKSNTNTLGNIFVIFVLLLFFLILYSSFGRETFAQQCGASAGRKLDDQLLDPDRMEIYQGVSIPSKYKPTRTDISDPAAPPIDGDPESLRAMNMFAFNKCAPECCLDSPYSCDRGCVCITPKQYQFLDKRGDNRQPNACNFERKI